MMRIFFIAAFFLLSLPLSAQLLHFREHPIREVYPNAYAELIYEDRNGLFWLGAMEGLFRFDGMNFRQFLKTDSSSNHVRSIYRDVSQRLWVGYQDGSVYQLSGEQLLPWTPEEGSPAAPVTGFAEDGQGHLWLATYGEGLYFLHDGRMYNVNTDDGLSGNDIYTLATDPWGRIWAATDNGISICSALDGKKEISYLDRSAGLPDDIVTALLRGPEAMWIGTYGGGFCRYDLQHGTIEHLASGWGGGAITSLEVFKGRDLWIGTEGGGLWRYFQQEGDFQSLPGWEGAKIHDLHKDGEGNIWVISNKRGVSSANRQFEFIPHELDNVQAMLIDRNGQRWVGAAQGLFLLQDRGAVGSRFALQQMVEDLNVISLYEDPFGNLLIGTFGQGLYFYHAGDNRLRRFTEEDGLTNDNILSMDGTGDRIWLATLGGVTEVELRGDPLRSKPVFRNMNQGHGLGANFIYGVLVDQQGRVWFGTDGQGVSVLEGGKITNYNRALHQHEQDPREGRQLLGAVYSIAEDRRGHIWLSTANQGIFEFDGKNFTHLTSKEGIRDLAISSLVTDEKGRILVVHSSGIDLLSPETHHLIYYDDEVGIMDFDPHLNAVAADTSGNIWIGAARSIIKYNALAEDLTEHPRTLLRSVSVFLEPIDMQDRHSFSAGENNLVFDYVGLWYTDPLTVKYRYQLGGYDLDWIESRDRQATYSNLPPGRYTFRVMSTQNDAWSDEPTVSWAFQVRSPFWRRWWFLLLSLLILTSTFYGYLQVRDRRRERVLLLEKEKTQNELAALKAQINPHFLFNSFNTLAAVIEDDQQVAVEYVEILADFYRAILQLRDKEIISLEEEIRLAHSQGYLLQKRFGEHFQLEITVDTVPPAYVAPLTLQILVENAVKHNVISKSHPLVVQIKRQGDELVVINNLQPKEQFGGSTRFGLQSLRRRYELLGNQKVVIKETESHFIVHIPLIR